MTRSERADGGANGRNGRGGRWSRRDLLRLLGAAGALAAAGSLAACGGEEGRHSVVMGEEMVFRPQRLTIRLGDTVTWRNDSGFVHTATADPTRARDPDHVELPPGAEPWDSGSLGRGESWSYRFDVPGRYRYFCVPHEAANMVGSIVVEPAEA